MIKIVVDVGKIPCGVLEEIGKSQGIYQKKGEDWEDYLDRIVDELRAPSSF